MADGPEYRILGPLEVRVGGKPVPLGGGKQRALLAVLLLHRNAVVSTGRLVDVLWDGAPPETAPTALHGHVSALRRLLEPERQRGDEGRVLVTRAPGYELRVEPGQLDLDRFDALAAEGRSALAAGDAQRASAGLGEALALWRGPALAELEADAFVHDALPALEERRLAALEDRVDADLALGRHGELVAELEAAVRHDPLRERLRAQLVLALYRSGRQGEALEAYAAARRTLVEQLGLEPGPALRELERQVLRQDPALDAPPRSPAPQTRPPASPVRRRRRRTALVAAGVGLAALAAATAFAAWPEDADDAEERAAPAAVASTTAPVVTDAPVTTAAAAETAPPPPEPMPDAVVRLDPVTGAVEAAFAVGTRPTTVAVGEGRVWTLNAADGTITRLDPATGDARTFGVGGYALDLAVGGGALWVLADNGATVYRVDPVTLLPGSPTALGVAGLRRVVDGVTTGGTTIVAGEDGVWAVAPSARIAELDPADGALRRILAPTLVNTLALGDNALWATTLDGAVLQVDRASGRVTRRIEVPAAGHAGIAATAEPDVAWMTDPIEGTVWHIDVRGRRPLLRTVSTANGGAGVAADGTAVWVTSGLEGTVTRVDAKAAGEPRRVELGHEALNAAVAADGVWVTLGSSVEAQPTAPGADLGNGVQALPTPPCGPVAYEGGGSPQLLIAAELPLQGVSSRQAQTVGDVVLDVLRARGFRAGTHRVGYQRCDDSTTQSGGWEAERCAANGAAYAANPAVVGVVGPYNSGCATVLLPVTNAAPAGPLAVVSPSNSYVGLTTPSPTAPGELARLRPGGRNGYVRVYASDTALAAAMVDLARRAGMRRLAIIEGEADGSYAVDLAEALGAAAEDAALPVVVRAAWAPDPEGYGSLATRLARRRVDAILVAGTIHTDGGALVAQVHDRLPDALVMAPESFGDGPALRAALGVTEAPWLLVVSAGAGPERISPAWRPLLARVDGDAFWVPFAAAAATALLDAIARSDGTRADVARALRETDLPDSPLGRLRFDEVGDIVGPALVALQLAPGGEGVVPGREDFADGLALAPQQPG